ncbi:uncharacterized protein PSFLO_00528 [Pseudozyma flocculosa]|uniref:Uncharacterized protein n=1 Tax=Pseudozyma flocculosa TaxID=84751 RepID=A0A5C3EUA0_9BASI|nr:uncharacterized protein PSFLO_00528 [Pseudozyma flocculosa]
MAVTMAAARRKKEAVLVITVIVVGACLAIATEHFAYPPAVRARAAGFPKLCCCICDKSLKAQAGCCPLAMPQFKIPYCVSVPLCGLAAQQSIMCLSGCAGLLQTLHSVIDLQMADIQECSRHCLQDPKGITLMCQPQHQ